MQTFNHISTAIFDVLLVPFGHEHAAFDLLLWPTLMGVLAILVYKLVSNQKSLLRVKSQISMRLLEIRLCKHRPLAGPYPDDLRARQPALHLLHGTGIDT